MKLIWVLLASLFLLPVLALIGWAIGNPYLKSIHPDVTAFNPTLAVYFLVMASAMLISLVRPAKTLIISKILGILLLFAGSIVLLRVTGVITIPIDSILFQESLGTNRIAPNTGVALLCLGLSLVFFAHGMKRPAYVFLGLNVFISALSLIGYAFGLRYLFGIAQFTPMALYTTLCFPILCAIIIYVVFGARNIYINKRILASLLLALLIAFGSSAVAVHSLRRMTSEQEQVYKTSRLVQSVDQLRMLLIDAETGQRGYLLTGNPSYLEPYHDAISKIDQELESIRQELHDEPVLQESLRSLTLNTAAKVELINETISLKRAGKDEVALGIINTNRGKEYLDFARRDLDVIEAWSNHRLEEVLSELRNEQQKTAWFLAISTAINMAIITAAFFAIQQAMRRQVESYKVLNIEKQKLETLLGSIGDGVFVIDSNRRIILFNEAASNISGYKTSEVVGKRYDQILEFTYEDNQAVNDTFIKEALAGRRAEMANHTQLRHADGHYVPVADSAAPFRSVDHKTIDGVVVVFRDVSNDRKLEQAKDDFVSLASHQLRTPATAVKQLLGLIIDGYSGDIDPKQLDLIKLAASSNDEEIQLINDLLQIAHLETGDTTLSVKPTDMNNLIADITKRQMMLVNNKKQHLIFKPTEHETIVAVDEGLLKTAIDNLVNNASKYTPDGGSITVTLERESKDVSITITDTGVGIAKQDIAKLFNRFSRLNNPKTQKEGGTGLGLYLAKLIVDLHGGAIEVESEEDKGTTFSIILPIKEKES